MTYVCARIDKRLNKDTCNNFIRGWSIWYTIRLIVWLSYYNIKPMLGQSLVFAE